MKRVVVGLSGGVDSSVAAYLLKKQGYDVIGMFMKNWHDETVTISNDCPWVEDSNDALLVAQKLGIPFQTIDLSKEYKERIVDYMFAEYEAGRTPNPDVLCNREIKFDIFLKAALHLNADFVATGHYCQKETIQEDDKTIHRLLAGKDKNKDQSYFLCQLTQNQLAKALFPIGHLEKPQVREIAKAQDLITAEKKDSQGLCFVGKIRLPDFLQQQLFPKTGQIIEISAKSPLFESYNWKNRTFSSQDEQIKFMAKAYSYQKSDGEIIGEHTGAHYFTIGQRKGLSIGGKPLPLFVIATDVKENLIYVGQGDQHQGLNRQGLYIQNSDIHWIREDLKLPQGKSMRLQVRIRYRQALEAANLFQKEEGMYIIFDRPQRGITPGQFAAWYQGEELLGSGVITH